MAQQRVLVTGASGFVGGRLVARLAARADVVPIALSRRRPAALPAGVEHVSVDLGDVRAAVRAIGALRPDAAVHLAALAHPGDCAADPAAAFRVQVGGTAAVLGALAAAPQRGRRPRALVVSTAAVYGRPRGAPLAEDAPLAPETEYGRSKRAAEGVARALGDRVHVVVARPFNHGGAGQEPRYVLPSFAAEIRRALAAGEPPRTGNLFPRRDFLHVDDVLDAYELLLARGASGTAYNVCRGETVAIGDVLRGLQQRLGAAAGSRTDPSRLRPGEPEEIAGDPARLVALGWRPRVSMDALLDELATG